MDFAFSEEQQMLREQARSFLSDRFPADRVVEIAERESWDSPSLARKELAWQEIAELGWVGLSVPEDKGGAGFGFLEEAVLFEELGYALYPGPYFSTVGMALPALVHDGDTLAKITSGESAATFVMGSGDGTLLVPDLRSADVVVVAQPDRIIAVETDGIASNITDVSTMDTTRRLATLAASNLSGTELAAGGDATSLLETIRLRTLAALALEAVGVAQFALDAAQNYVKERKQFDKPIGSYQAVSHQVSDMYMAVELARSLAYWAAWTVAESDEAAPGAVAAAIAAGTEAAVKGCERAIQVHGGIGFTWEHILHRYYKRAEWIAAFAGSPSEHRKAIAERIFA